MTNHTTPDFCGHSEQEANFQLWRWLHQQKCHLSIFVEITKDLNLCRLIESRLSDEQLSCYSYLLSMVTAYPVRNRETEMIMLDAPTRVRALLTVLGLAKPTATHETDICCADVVGMGEGE